MASRTKKQHFIPRFYLRNFSNEDGLVWTHDSSQDTLRQTSPEKTGLETNIYTPEIEEGERLDLIEDFLSKIESVSANILPELTQCRSLDPASKAEFSYFIATMYARSPSQLRQFAALSGQIANWMGMHQLEHEHRKKIESGTVTEIDLKVQEFLRDKNNYKISVDRRMGLQAFAHCKPLAEIISTMCWSFEVSEEQQLLTSDNAVFWISGSPEARASPYGFGIGNRHAVIPFPISPNVILRLDWHDSPDWKTLRLNKKRARLANQYQAKYKEKFLFFRDRDEGFRRLGMKYIKPAKNIDVGVPSPEVNVVRKL